MVLDLPEQLIAQAEALLTVSPPNEASIRRAVSTAYYSLFHLLVRDTVANWREPLDHPRLARVFEHKQMKAASISLLADLSKRPMGESGLTLRWVAQAFVDLQQARHKADYDLSHPFDWREAEMLVSQARTAINDWSYVNAEPIAQRYLYSLLFRDKT